MEVIFWAREEQKNMRTNGKVVLAFSLFLGIGGCFVEELLFSLSNGLEEIGEGFEGGVLVEERI